MRELESEEVRLVESEGRTVRWSVRVCTCEVGCEGSIGEEW